MKITDLSPLGSPAKFETQADGDDAGALQIPRRFTTPVPRTVLAYHVLEWAAVVAQNEVDTWTIHQVVPPDTDPNAIDPLTFIYTNLGGLGDSYPVKVDEVLVKSTWRFDLATADSFRSAKGRVFLAGDAGTTNFLFNASALNFD